jgi:hypothetical protein
MRDTRAVVNSDPAKTRATFAKYIERITLTPSGEHYVASGTWNFVGPGSIGGAEEGSGPNVCRFGLSGWLLRDDAGIAALPSVQIVGLSGYEINVSWWVEPLRW